MKLSFFGRLYPKPQFRYVLPQAVVYCIACETYRVETLLKKGPPPGPLPKTSNSFLARGSCIIIEQLSVHIFAFSDRKPPPSQKELKVFGKGFGEEPFFRKVFRYGKLLFAAIHNRIGINQKSTEMPIRHFSAFEFGYIVFCCAHISLFTSGMKRRRRTIMNVTTTLNGLKGDRGRPTKEK